MKYRLAVLLMIGMLPGVFAGTEWVPLFNGTDFTGWTFDVLDGSPPESIWAIQDGMIVASGKGKPVSVLRTGKSYSNYELEFEWRWPGEAGNSGCLIHCSAPRKMSVWPASLEVQLQSGNAGDLILIGEAIDVNESQRATFKDEKDWRVRLRNNLTDGSEKPVGEWNRMRIVAMDSKVEVLVNGQLVNKGWNASVNQGAICFQSEKADIQFRNFRIRERE